MCRILGHFLREGCAAKLADDLYCGGDTPQELLTNWSQILDALTKCNLRLSACKTVICPKTITILGWIWSQGSLSASPHRITALATCRSPESVKGFVPLSVPTKSLAVSSLTALNLWTHSSQPWPICNLTTTLSGTNAFAKDSPLHKMPLTRTSLSSSLVPPTSFGL